MLSDEDSRRASSTVSAYAEAVEESEEIGTSTLGHHLRSKFEQASSCCPALG